jgi:hypothetical protein
MEEHKHIWYFAPVMTTNPEEHYRQCTECNLWQSRRGPTYGVTEEGKSILVAAATDWEDYSESL